MKRKEHLVSNILVHKKNGRQRGKGTKDFKEKK
jgi:hypothetical protein